MVGYRPDAQRVCRRVSKEMQYTARLMSQLFAERERESVCVCMCASMHRRASYDNDIVVGVQGR